MPYDRAPCGNKEYSILFYSILFYIAWASFRNGSHFGAADRGVL